MDYQLGTVFPAFRDAVLGLIRSTPENRDPEKIAASVRTTADTLAILDDHLRDREYVAGDSLTIGDLALGRNALVQCELLCTAGGDEGA